MRLKRVALLVALAVLVALPALADTLELKDGRTLEGKFLGANDTAIQFEVGGIKMEVPKDQVANMTMGGAPAASAAPATPAAPAAEAAPAAAAGQIQVPAGAVMKFKLGQPLTSKDPPGKQFTGVLETSVTANGQVAIPAGTKVLGQVKAAESSKRTRGKAEVVIALTEVVLGGVSHPIVVQPIGFEGSSKGKETGRRAARGALIGGAINGSDGAKDGAMIGLGLSMVGAGGQDIQVPPGTILDFRLAQPASFPTS